MFSEVSNLTEFSRSAAERERASSNDLDCQEANYRYKTRARSCTNWEDSRNRGWHFRDRHTLSRHCHEGHSEWKEHSGERKK